MGKASRHKARRQAERSLADDQRARTAHIRRWVIFYAAFVLLSAVLLPALYDKYGHDFLGKPAATDTKEKRMITIETDKGTIKAELYPDKAPKTVAHITELVQKGFYNGLTFHRVEPGFVVQGGDPTGTGAGGSGTKVPLEVSDLKHETGSLAMARNPQDKDSNDSQFYITLAPQPSLDGEYTVFGKVTSGMDVVEKIAKGDKMTKVSFDQ